VGAGVMLLLTLGGCGLYGPRNGAVRAADRFEAGHPEALAIAERRASRAIDLSPHDAESWAARARVDHLYLLHPEHIAPHPDPVDRAVEAFGMAVELKVRGASHGALARRAPSLVGASVVALTDAGAREDWVRAQRLARVSLRAVQVAEALGASADAYLEPLHRMGARAAAEQQDAAAAWSHYRGLTAVSDTLHPGLAVAVAQAVAQAGDPAGALGILVGVAEAQPVHEGVLRAQLALWRAQGQPHHALRRLEAVTPALKQSVQGTMLAAELTSAAGAAELARELWAHALSMDSGHFEAHLLLGDSLIVAATALATELADSEELQTRRQSDELRVQTDRLAALWARGTAQLRAARLIDPTHPAPVRGLIRALQARVRGVEPELLQDAALAAHHADVASLRDLRNTLAELESR